MLRRPVAKRFNSTKSPSAEVKTCSNRGKHHAPSTLVHVSIRAALHFSRPPSAALRADIGLPRRPTLGNGGISRRVAREVQPRSEKVWRSSTRSNNQESEKTFADAATREPNAPSRTGARHGLFHQLWGFSGRQNPERGPQRHRETQKLHAANPREQGFINAGRRFLSERNPRRRHAERTQASSAALEHFYSANSGDANRSSLCSSLVPWPT